MEHQNVNYDRTVLYDHGLPDNLFCFQCEEPFILGDRIITFDNNYYQHYECYLNAIHEKQLLKHSE